MPLRRYPGIPTSPAQARRRPRWATRGAWVAGALLACALTHNAHAWGIGSYYQDHWIAQDMLRRTYENHNRTFGQGSSRKARQGKAQQPASNPKAYQYTFSQAVSDQVASEFIEQLLADTRKRGALEAATEQKIRTMAGWNFVPAVRERLHKKAGSPKKDNVAQAIAFWLVINYGTIHKSQNTDMVIGPLVQQFEVALSKDQGMLSMSDADKQRMAESLLWQSLVQMVAQEEAGNDPARLQAAADQARANLRSVGIDADALHITKQGLALGH
ncbi:hypothetical protein EBQ34_06605 [Vandammella animalimorsus]|uniref:Uncharacterized protein n=1 Tax=Vandammella animalimorsus TaxID=2029117 RepID=A0A3M6RKB6_9BURK|nr:DUF6683 family protein [Vandammella animalimorsus]RMX15368.1 hypothetical protein EBQ34_06605 [Vandammella animalimorsus]